MSDDRIGQWCHRVKGGKCHLVQSRIADRYVTRCGRQLEASNQRALIFIEAPTWDFAACQQCA